MWLQLPEYQVLQPDKGFTVEGNYRQVPLIDIHEKDPQLNISNINPTKF